VRTSPDGTVAQQIQWLQQNGCGQYVSYYNGITDQTVPDSIAQTVWATCQHSSQTQQALNFFGWHRMYIYYYERVLRWASGDDTLRLPYWDYTLPSEVPGTSSVRGHGDFAASSKSGYTLSYTTTKTIDY